MPRSLAPNLGLIFRRQAADDVFLGVEGIALVVKFIGVIMGQVGDRVYACAPQQLPIGGADARDPQQVGQPGPIEQLRLEHPRLSGQISPARLARCQHKQPFKRQDAQILKLHPGTVGQGAKIDESDHGPIGVKSGLMPIVSARSTAGKSCPSGGLTGE